MGYLIVSIWLQFLHFAWLQLKTKLKCVIRNVSVCSSFPYLSPSLCLSLLLFRICCLCLSLASVSAFRLHVVVIIGSKRELLPSVRSWSEVSLGKGSNKVSQRFGAIVFHSPKRVLCVVEAEKCPACWTSHGDRHYA